MPEGDGQGKNEVSISHSGSVALHGFLFQIPIISAPFITPATIIRQLCITIKTPTSGSRAIRLTGGKGNFKKVLLTHGGVVIDCGHFLIMFSRKLRV